MKIIKTLSDSKEEHLMRNFFYLILVLTIMLVACQSDPVVVTERVESEQESTTITPASNSTSSPTKTTQPTKASPPLPTKTPTRTPAPTRTLTPTIAPPEILTHFLEGVKVVSTDPFDGYSNWDTYPSGEVYIRNGELTINGTSFWQSSSTNKSSFREGDGVYFEYKYSQGPEFEMSFDVGQWQTDNYRRFGVNGFDNPSANLWQGPNAIGGWAYLVGNLDTRPDTWYSILMAIGEDAEFLAVIWDPEDPSKNLVYNETINEKWIGKTWKFHFGANKGTINIDNFGKFSFEAIK
jgi:hypothetical protein